MSYEVVTDEESQGQFASNAGYADLIAAAKGHAAAAGFFEAGETDDVSAVIQDLDAIAKAGDTDVAETARTLARLLKGSKTALITDGVI